MTQKVESREIFTRFARELKQSVSWGSTDRNIDNEGQPKTRITHDLLQNGMRIVCMKKPTPSKKRKPAARRGKYFIYIVLRRDGCESRGGYC